MQFTPRSARTRRRSCAVFRSTAVGRYTPPMKPVRLGIPASLLASLAMAAGAVEVRQSEVDNWETFLRPQYFDGREITESQALFELRVPVRAEDSGVVPVSINAQIPQTPERFISRLYLFVDNNPKPLAGVFSLTPEMGRADLAMRLRVEQYTFIRAVAELNTGELYMDKAYTRASSGCSEPPAHLKLKQARERIGEVRFRTREGEGDASLAQLMISHPQVTGLQLDQRTRAFIPPEYVTKVAIRFNDRPIMTAETDISISEDPSFRFFFRPEEGGVVSAEVTDSKGRNYTRTFEIAGTGNPG